MRAIERFRETANDTHRRKVETRKKEKKNKIKIKMMSETINVKRDSQPKNSIL